MAKARALALSLTVAIVLTFPLAALGQSTDVDMSTSDMPTPDIANSGSSSSDSSTYDAPPSDAPTSDLPALEDVIARTEARLAAIYEVELVVELEQYNATDGSLTPGKGKLLARMPDLFRFDWLQPDMMAGSILLVDREKNEAHQYNPIREEIIVQRWDRLAAQQNLVPEIDRWLAVPSPDDYDLRLGGVEHIGDQLYYVVLARPNADPRQLYEFLIDPETWLVREFRYFDAEERLALRGLLTDVRINGGPTESRIRDLPRARIRHL